MTPLPSVQITAPSGAASRPNPFAVGHVLWRDTRGGLVCTVIAKVTYELLPGAARTAEPIPLQDEDGHWDDEPTKSVHAPSDLAPFKNAAEVVLVGSAFAERPVRSVVARLIVGSVDKSLEAFTARRFTMEGAVEDAIPQRRFALRWEHAAASPDNPAGIDTTRGDTRGRIPIPPILPPYFQLGAPGAHVPAIGFGPIAAGWPSRIGDLGSLELAWLARPAAAALPGSFPARYFQSAPMDQWLDRTLVANERVVLEGLSAQHPRLATNLPGIEPRAIVLSAGRMPLRFTADSLFIDTDRGIGTLTFRAPIMVEEGTQHIRVAVLAAQMGAQIPEEDLAIALRSEEEDELVLTATDSGALDGGDPDVVTRTGAAPPVWMARPALPFGGSPRQEDVPVQVPPPRPSAPNVRRVFEDPLTHDASSRASSPDLPFVQIPGPAKAPSVAPPSPPPPIPIPQAAPPAPPPPPPPAIVPPAPPAIVPPAPALSYIAPAAESLTMGQQAAAAASPPPVTPPKPITTEPAKPAKASFDSAFGGSSKASTGGNKGSFGSAFGTRAASDAAAEARPKDTAEGAAKIDRQADGPPRRLAVVDLLHADPGLGPRLRLMKRFAPLFAPAARARSPQGVDDPRADPPADSRERADVLRVLSCSRPVEAAEIHGALGASLDDMTDFELPLVLVAGELKPSFDEIELLRAAVSVAQPVAGPEKKLAASIAVAQEALAAPAAPRPDTAIALARRIEQETAALSLPARWFATELDRMLIEGRKYKRRSLLGAPRVRADLTVARSGEVLTLYLPDSASGSLPLLPSFPMIALCEVRPREDMAEPQPEALFASALGRVLHGRIE